MDKPKNGQIVGLKLGLLNKVILEKKGKNNLYFLTLIVGLIVIVLVCLLFLLLKRFESQKSYVCIYIKH